MDSIVKGFLIRAIIWCSNYLVAIAALSIWRAPSECGGWHCDVSKMAILLYMITGLGAAELAIRCYNYWKARKCDHVGNL